MKILWRFLLLSSAIAIGGCAGINFHKSPVQPPGGLIYTHYKAPLTTNLHSTSRGSKIGVSQASFLREPFFGTSYAWGDASIQAAAIDGELTQIDYADYEFLQVLGLFSKLTVRVHGD